MQKMLKICHFSIILRTSMNGANFPTAGDEYVQRIATNFKVKHSIQLASKKMKCVNIPACRTFHISIQIFYACVYLNIMVF